MFDWIAPSHKVCPPDYTPQECAVCRSDNPRCWDHPHPIPEPDVIGLLTAALIAGLVVRRLRRK